MSNTLELINKEQLKIVYELLGRCTANSKAQRAEIRKLRAEKAKWESSLLFSLEAADSLDPEISSTSSSIAEIKAKGNIQNKIEYVGWNPNKGESEDE